MPAHSVTAVLALKRSLEIFQSPVAPVPRYVRSKSPLPLFKAMSFSWFATTVATDLYQSLLITVPGVLTGVSPTYPLGVSLTAALLRGVKLVARAILLLVFGLGVIVAVNFLPASLIHALSLLSSASRYSV